MPGGTSQYINFTTGSTGAINFTGAGITASTVYGYITNNAVEYNNAVAPTYDFVVTSGSGQISLALQTGEKDGIWTSTGSGNWSDIANWQNGNTPGLNSSFTNTDTATFGTVAGGASAVTVNITTPSPSLAAVTFNSTNSYTIGLGAGGTNLTLSSTTGTATVEDSLGNHTIAAPVVLGSNTTMDAASGTTLTVSGAVSGTKNLTVTGSGNVILSGSNSYSGTTDVSGNLNLAATGAAGATSQVTVENGGSLIFGSSSTPTTGALNAGATVLLAGGGSIITNGSIETIGTLTLIGSDTGQLDLTSTTNSGVLLTLSGDGSTWSSILNINGWSDGSNSTLMNEIAASSLTSGELADITWTNVTYNGMTYGTLTGGAIVGGILTPTITPVPEPSSTVFSGLLLLGLVGLTPTQADREIGGGWWV